MRPRDPANTPKNHGCTFTLITEKDDEDVYGELVKFAAKRWLLDPTSANGWGLVVMPLDNSEKSIQIGTVLLSLMVTICSSFSPITDSQRLFSF